MRAVRKWFTDKLTDAALVAAPRTGPRSIDTIESFVAHFGRFCPVVSRIVASNMRTLGLYSPQAHRDYFARIATHLADQLHILRNAPRDLTRPVTTMPAELDRLVRRRILLDASFNRLNQAAALGKGVIIMAPHVVDLPLWMARLSQEVPLSVYMRDTKNPTRRHAKQLWYHSAGFEAIVESSRNPDPLDTEQADANSSRNRLIEALGRRRTVVITPDIPQKDRPIKPVRFFDRQVCLPRGAAILSKMTNAPLLTMVAEPAGATIRLILQGPFPTEANSGGVQERMQWFTDCFVDFLRAHPSLWFFWGDKRWTRVFKGDTRYIRSTEHALPATKVRSEK